MRISRRRLVWDTKRTPAVRSRSPSPSANQELPCSRPQRCLRLGSGRLQFLLPASSSPLAMAGTSSARRCTVLSLNLFVARYSDLFDKRRFGPGQNPANAGTPRYLYSRPPRVNTKPNTRSAFELDFRVTRAGFEPAISTLRGWRPGPLDERAILRATSANRRGGDQEYTRSTLRITKRIPLTVSETLQVLLSTTPADGPARISSR